MAKSRYDEMLITLQNQGWAQEEIDAYVANFNEIYEEICRSIKEKSQKNGKSGLEQNEIFTTLRRDVKYELAAVATEKIKAGKPFTMYTDSVKGPQGDLRIALNRVGYLKNYIPNLVGVKIPLANKAPNAKQLTDKHAIGPMQLFCALDRGGVMNIQDYYSYLIDRADEVMESRNCQPVITSDALPMFSSLSGYALRTKMEADGRVYPRDSKEYIGRYKYAQVRFLETVIDKMETEGTFAFTFNGHAPAGDLAEALAGTMFETKKVKTRDGKIEPRVIFSDRGQISDDPVIIENIMPDSSYKGRDRFCGTSALFLTRAGLDLYGYHERVVETALSKPKRSSTAMTFPLFENGAINEQLSMYYSDSEIYLLAQKYRDVCSERYRTPIFKGFCSKPSQETIKTIQKPTKKSQSAAAAQRPSAPKSLVYIPTGRVSKPQATTTYSRQSTEISRREKTAGEARLALMSFEGTVKSDMYELDSRIDEVLEEAIHYLQEQNPYLSQENIEIYTSYAKRDVYTMIRRKIEREGSVELTFGENGPTGDFRAALDGAHAVYTRFYRETPPIDYSGMKGFNMGTTDAEYYSAKHPVGNMTIEADGKITIKENAQSTSKTQDGGKAQ